MHRMNDAIEHSCELFLSAFEHHYHFFPTHHPQSTIYAYLHSDSIPDRPPHSDRNDPLPTREVV